MIYEELQAKIKHLPDYKKYKKAFDVLDEEKITDIILDQNVFWFEFSSFDSIDNKTLKLLTEYIKNKGYVYLHDIPNNI